MRLLPVLLATIACLAAPRPAHASEKKPIPVTVRLHGEGKEQEGPSFVTSIELTNPAKKIFIRKVPAVNERDIKAFYPFPGHDGLIGAYFRLDAHGTNKLDQFTIEEKGKLAVVLINGRVSAALHIENRVGDGILFVPGGIKPDEIVLLEQRFPVIGRESQFGQKPAPEKKQKK